MTCPYALEHPWMELKEGDYDYDPDYVTKECELCGEVRRTERTDPDPEERG